MVNTLPSKTKDNYDRTNIPHLFAPLVLLDVFSEAEAFFGPFHLLISKNAR